MATQPRPRTDPPPPPPPSTRSERIRLLAVFGNAVVDADFCERFMQNPIATTEAALDDALSPYERYVLDGIQQLPQDQRNELCNRFMTARGGRNCPNPPCPSPI